ncbi:MAG: biotin/lipoyl-binding protein [Clostridiales bacterium]|nr:biotin/lipoyl-binding protein [Clostridiales bacterium]
MRKFNVNVNGKIYVVEIEETGAKAPVKEDPKAEAPKAEAPAPQVTGGAVNVESPMPGTILDVKVQVGTTVKAGDLLCILEAMKMENEILAPQDGTVKSVVTKGSTVNTGDILVGLE